MSTLATYTLTTPDAIPLEQVRRALIIKLRHHGDVLLTTPVFSVLKEHAPHIEIDGLVYADTAPMLSLHPALSQLHTIDRNWKKLGLLARLKAEWALKRALKSRAYDLVIHLTEHPRGARLVRQLQPRWSVAPSKRNAYWKNTFTHFYGPHTNPKRHTVETHLDAARRLGLNLDRSDRRLTLVPGRDATHNISQLLKKHALEAGNYVHIHPTSRWLFKCWRIDSNAALLKQLYTRGETLVLTAAPDAEELKMVQAIAQQADVPIVNLAGQLSLKELAALTQQAKLFIGVDSAPMHIAAAMGTPSVVLFGPSGDLEWGPWHVPHTIITSQHTCRPCGRDGCGGSKISECLTSLPVTRVLDACVQHLEAQ